MRGCSDHDIPGRKGQAQATILARVAYVLLHTFILSTVFRCKADVHCGWLGHVAYVAGFCAALLVSAALYIALTFMDPGYIPAVTALKLQAQKQDEPKAHEARGGQNIRITGRGGARSSALSVATAPAFDFEGLLHGADQLPREHSLADAPSDSIEPRWKMAVHGSAAALQAAAAKTKQGEQGHGSSKHSLSLLEEGCCWRAQEAETAGLAPIYSSSLACTQQHQTGHNLSSTGDRGSYSHAAPHTAGKAHMLPDEGSLGSKAGQLIGALHVPGWPGEHDSESGPGSRERAWWERAGSPGRRCERCGAFQRLRAHHCGACQRCVDTHDHHCAWLGTCIGARNQCMYLGFLLSQAASCAWAAHAVLPCLADPQPLLPWHTLFGVDWRAATSMLLLLGFLLPFLAYLIAQQLYLAATAQTARECFRRDQVPYLMHVNRRVHPFSRGCARNLWEYVAWRAERHWELPSIEELLDRQMHAGKGCGLC